MTKEKKENIENTSMILGGERDEEIEFLEKEFIDDSYKKTFEKAYSELHNELSKE